MLNRELSREISKLSEYKLVNERWNIKVYDLLRFTKILFHLNDKRFDNIHSEVYKVEGSTLEFSANGRDLSVSYSNKTPLKEFNNQHEFIRFMLGTDIIHDHNSSIFPLYIDVNLADKF
jgi:hypothetical protein